jgi:hypothetical protein
VSADLSSAPIVPVLPDVVATELARRLQRSMRVAMIDHPCTKCDEAGGYELYGEWIRCSGCGGTGHVLTPLGDGLARFIARHLKIDLETRSLYVASEVAGEDREDSALKSLFEETGRPE